MGGSSSGEAVSHSAAPNFDNADPIIRGLYDPGLEKDACGVGFAW